MEKAGEKQDFCLWPAGLFPQLELAVGLEAGLLDRRWGLPWGRAGFRTPCNNRGPSSPHRGECHSPFWALPSPIWWKRAQGWGRSFRLTSFP